MRTGGWYALIVKPWQWVKGLVQEVPEDVAVCEFECRKTTCLQGDWEACERRRRGMVKQPSKQAKK